VDKSRTARSGGARLGGSLFSTPSLPPELQPLEKPQSALSRLEASSRPLITTANTDYTKLTDPATPLPSPPVYAARLSSLLKNLASAEGAVNDSIKARNELIAGLEKLLESNKAKLSEEQTTSADLSSRRTAIETKKKEVEDGIMRGLSADSSAVNTPTMNQAQAIDGSPEVESFTPPPPDVENFTPTGSPEPAYPADEGAYPRDFLETGTYAADPIQEQEPKHEEPPPAFEPPPVLQTGTPSMSDGASMLLNSLTRPAPDSTSSNSAPSDPRLKRRKMNHSPDMDEEIFGVGEGVGLDQDVAAMLGAR
jgi:regulator of Ty1 transposition protein 103